MCHDISNTNTFCLEFYVIELIVLRREISIFYIIKIEKKSKMYYLVHAPSTQIKLSLPDSFTSFLKEPNPKQNS
jgi:hypothetical protein